MAIFLSEMANFVSSTEVVNVFSFAIMHVMLLLLVRCSVVSSGRGSESWALGANSSLAWGGPGPARPPGGKSGDFKLRL